MEQVGGVGKSEKGRGMERERERILLSGVTNPSNFIS